MRALQSPHLVLVVLLWQFAAMAIAPLALHCRDEEAGAHDLAGDDHHQARATGSAHTHPAGMGSHHHPDPGSAQLPARHPDHHHRTLEAAPDAVHQSDGAGDAEPQSAERGRFRPNPHCDVSAAALVALIGLTGTLPSLSTLLPPGDAGPRLFAFEPEAVSRFPRPLSPPPRA